MTANSLAEAICPKCRREMIYVAVTPHPVRPSMQRTTFVCYGCNQTRTYMLPAPSAEIVPSAQSGIA